MKMNPLDKTRWIQALRSGKFEQCQGNLHMVDAEYGPRYCCLGVLGAICGIKRHSDGDELLEIEDAIDIGLEHAMQTNLAAMNDNGDSFSKIADFIQENL